MIPETLAGLVVFAAAAGPGYLFVHLAERYGPRRDRSTLEEAAELLVVGAVATTAAFLVAVGVVGVDSRAVADDADRYVVAHPFGTLAVMCLTVALSYGSVWLITTQLFYRSHAREIEPGGSMWYAAFKRLVPENHGTFVTVERRDGSALSGLLGSATADESERRELLIIAPENRPIYSRPTRDAEPVGLTDTFVIVRGDDVDVIAGAYHPVSGDSPPARRWSRRSG